MKKMLITGGAGFIGHFLVNEFIDDYKIICIVRPGTKSLNRLVDVKDKIEFIEHDIRHSLSPLVDRLEGLSIILHAGANPSSESSINDPTSVILDNVVGTVNLLELARLLKVDRFVYYSSAEVFGPVKIGEDSTEDAAYNSNSPYAASKAGGEELCVSYSNAFDLPVSILHMTNTFGPMCQPNRYPVILIRKLLNNEAIDIHVGENNSIGGRRWFYAGDVADQTRFILTTQTSKCEKWNSAGNQFINNFDLAKYVAEFLGKELVCNFILIDRPGHDLCFSITPLKIYNAGWTEKISTLDRLKETVDWYKANQSWLTF